ncbi:MAG: hypothetical protein GXY85_09505 [Candidatus Brocadiaceae bacterium]|nr:hypothetical protein [Candidatus Brocadiaceae bacterium]
MDYPECPAADCARAERLRRALTDWTGAAPADVRVVRSPYRVCPLGAHVDHQGGCVAGMAVDRALLAAYAPTADRCVAVRSLQFEGTARFALDAVPPRAGDWADYARGAASALCRLGPLRRGVAVLVDGSRNVGGLSSSAAAGLAYLMALASANDLELSARELIELDRAVENDYVGLNNGTLDQSMILLSRAGMLTHLDCATGRARRLAPGGGAEFRIAVLFSGLRTALHSTAYNARVAECRAAAEALLKEAGMAVPDRPRLRDVPPDVHARHAASLAPALRKRARHYFDEQARVADGLEAWTAGDLARFGRLMTESGRSSIELYECGTAHLRTGYEVLSGAPGVYGARFSGAGFRGCCVALVRPGCEAEIARCVLTGYLRAHPDVEGEAEVFFCRSGDGAAVLE